MNIGDFYHRRSGEYRLFKEHIEELVGEKVTSMQLSALGCRYGGVCVTNFSSGKSISKVWRTENLPWVVEELRAGKWGPLGNRREAQKPVAGR